MELGTPITMCQMKFNLTVEVLGDVLKVRSYLMQPDGTRASFEISSDLDYTLPDTAIGYAEWLTILLQHGVQRVAEVRGEGNE